MDRLGSLDATFLAIERPGVPMSAGTLAVFDGPAPDIAEVRAQIAGRLDLVPRCRQRVRVPRGGLVRPMWIDDVGFDLAEHVLETSLAAPGDVADLLPALMAVPLDLRRAPWELWVVTGLERLAVAVWSYDGVLQIGITGDRGGVPDLAVLRRGVEAGFEGLVALARPSIVAPRTEAAGG